MSPVPQIARRENEIAQMKADIRTMRFMAKLAVIVSALMFALVLHLILGTGDWTRAQIKAALTGPAFSVPYQSIPESLSLSAYLRGIGPR